MAQSIHFSLNTVFITKLPSFRTCETAPRIEVHAHKPDNWTLISGTLMIEGENCLPQVVL